MKCPKMKERPIILKPWEVRAFLDGRKTQLRRIVKWPCLSSSDGSKRRIFTSDDTQEMNRLLTARQKHPTLRGFCPFGQPGDRLWVRETWCTSVGCDDRAPSDMEKPGKGYGWPVFYPADDSVWWRGSQTGGTGFIYPGKRRSPIHMPRWASRITLEITNVRVERVQSISEEDARAEGITDGGCLNCGESEPCDCANPTPDARDGFAHLWQSTYGPDSWNANPWVWVVEVELKLDSTPLYPWECFRKESNHI